MTFYWRGWAHSGLGDRVAAIRDFDRAVELDPDRYDWQYALGLELGHAGQYQKSVEHLSRAIEISPDSGIAWYARAISLSRLGMVGRSADDLERACALGYADACDLLPRNQ
jgi:tetratricopeptide (TPR) repeat protein